MTFDDFVPQFSKCPRCGEKGYDVLRTHAYCVNCNFSPDYEQRWEPLIPDWAHKAMAEMSQRDSKHETESEVSMVNTSLESA